MHRINSTAARVVTSIGLGCAIALVVTGAKDFRPAFAELESFRIGQYSVTAGGSASGTATVGLSKGGVPIVSFSSSNPSVATVPASKAVSSTGTAVIEVKAVAAGCSRITASYGGRTRVADIVVHPVAENPSMSLTVPDRIIILGATILGSINRRMAISGSNAPGAGSTITLNPVTFVLSSTSPGVAKVPANQLQTSSTTPFSITGMADGCAIITAKSGAERASKTVRVVDIGG